MTTAKQKPPTARVTKLREEGPEAAARPPGQHVGDMLRKAREDRGMTLDMVADELMIRRFYLDALENGSFRDLPERVYATGFVRSYATYVGVDVNQFVDQFRRDAYGSRSATYQVELVMPEPVVHSVIPGRTVVLSAICALALLVGVVVYATRAKTGAVTTIPSPPDVASTMDVPSPEAVADTSTMAPSIAPPPGAATAVTNDAGATGFDLPAPPTETTPAATTTTAAAPVTAGLPAATASAALPATATSATTTATPASTTRLSVEALESSWVEVKDGKGGVLFTSILKKGQLLPIPDQKGITLTTGNAGGLRLLLDGQALPPLGQTNEVKRGFALDADKLAKR